VLFVGTGWLLGRGVSAEAKVNVSFCPVFAANKFDRDLVTKPRVQRAAQSSTETMKGINAEEIAKEKHNVPWAKWSVSLC
jgi:hypothetical protein